MLLRGALTEAGMDDSTVEQILAMLTDAQDAVKKSERIELAPAGSYGGAPTAAELGLHAGKAHHHVIDAMTQMAQGLRTYHENVAHLRKDVLDTDDTVATGFTRVAQRLSEPSIDAGTACLGQNNFHANPTCEVPGSDQ